MLSWNGDIATMAFEVRVLANVFGKTRDEPIKLMLEIHRHGSGVRRLSIGSPHPKVAKDVVELARQNNQLLRCAVQPDMTP